MIDIRRRDSRAAIEADRSINLPEPLTKSFERSARTEKKESLQVILAAQQILISVVCFDMSYPLRPGNLLHQRLKTSQAVGDTLL